MANKRPIVQYLGVPSELANGDTIANSLLDAIAPVSSAAIGKIPYLLDATGKSMAASGMYWDNTNNFLEIKRDNIGTDYTKAGLVVSNNTAATSSVSQISSLTLSGSTWNGSQSVNAKFILANKTYTFNWSEFHIFSNKNGVSTDVFGVDENGYFTKPVKMTAYNIGRIYSSGLQLNNNAASTATVSQYSPSVDFTNTGWDNTNLVNKNVSWRITSEAIPGAGNPVAQLMFRCGVNTVTPDKYLFGLSSDFGLTLYDNAATPAIRFFANPNVSDGASAVAYSRGTKNTLSTSGAKLDQVSNGGTEKYSLDFTGLGYFAGGVNIASGKTFQINGTDILASSSFTTAVNTVVAETTASRSTDLAFTGAAGDYDITSLSVSLAANTLYEINLIIQAYMYASGDGLQLTVVNGGSYEISIMTEYIDATTPANGTKQGLEMGSVSSSNAYLYCCSHGSIITGNATGTLKVQLHKVSGSGQSCTIIKGAILRIKKIG